MLEKLKIVWVLDWGEINRKNWAEKERIRFERENKEEYYFFFKKLSWFQTQSIDKLLNQKELERISRNKNGYKLNIKVYKKTVRIFGYLESNHTIFHVLLFLIKKTNKVPLKELKTFEERIKIYEK